MHEEREPDGDQESSPEDRPGEPGAEGGSQSPAADEPVMPTDDDSALGDTDQHSES